MKRHDRNSSIISPDDTILYDDTDIKSSKNRRYASKWMNRRSMIVFGVLSLLLCYSFVLNKDELFMMIRNQCGQVST